MRYFILLHSLFALGCATSTQQTDALLRADSHLPKSTLIENVPFIQQTAGYCGPASLAMAMSWAGRTVSVDELAAQVFTPGMKGSLQMDLISASRRQGLIAIPISGLEALLSEVAAGNPVIVFENLALSWLPQWHYAVVFGYDFKNEVVIMHSGPESFKHWDMRKFERSWKLGDYWGLVVLPPNKLSSSANELAHVKAAAALEQLKNPSAAQTSYRAIIERWPQSLSAHIGLANIAFINGQNREAELFLQQAVKNHPSSAVAWHNLAIVQGALQRKKSAQQSASRAFELASISEKKDYSQSLKAWLLNDSNSN